MRVFVDTNLWACRFDRRQPKNYTQAALQALTGFEVVTAEPSLIIDAHVLAEPHQLTWFDALIAEAAIRPLS